MKRKGVVNGLILSLVMVLCFTVNIYARDFSDVPEGFWAKDTINEMSDKNIIVGYTDGTFKPNNEIKKVEALVLLSRILGVNEQENEDLVNQAEDNYKDVLSQYDTYATKEISYLLQKKILRQDELDDYLGEGNDEISMLRYEVVPLVVRAMGKEEEVANKSLVILEYKDAEFIPEVLRGYVEYLGSEGLMGTATDDNRFLPNGAMTRAQVATLASRIIKKMEALPNNPINDTQENNKDITEPNVDNKVDDKISGVIQEIAREESGLNRIITVLTTVNGEKKSIKISIKRNAEIIVDGQKATVTLIKVGDYAIVDVNKNGEAEKVVTEKKDKTVKGTVVDVNIEKRELVVNIAGNNISYSVETDAGVMKNDINSDFNSVRKGDNIILVLEYNTVRHIILSSTQKTIEGTISEILISNKPKLTVINSKGDIETAELSNCVKVFVLDKSSDIYGLRLNHKVKLIFDSNEVEEVYALEQIRGTIESVVESFGEIVLFQEGENITKIVQLLTNQGTKFINAKDEAQLNMGDLKPGQKVIVNGVLGKTAFYVKEVIVVE